MLADELLILIIYISKYLYTKIKKPFYHKKVFLIENECKTPYGCLTLIFYQKYFL